MTHATGRHKNEVAFTRWFVEQVEATGCEVQAFVGNKMQGAGVTDRYVCHPRFRGWVEFKAGDRRATTAQRLFMERFLKRGDACLVVRYRSKEVMECEDPRGHALGWLNLVPLYCLATARERGQRLLNELAKAWDLYREKETQG